MEIHHFSHDHPLILSEEKYNKNFPCRICGEPIFGVSYCCQICPYVLHKWCSDLPAELSSHKHHLPDHPLILTPQNSSESSTIQNCKICKKEIKILGSAYTCFAEECCSFSIHVDCASFPEMINFEFPNIDNKTTSSTIYFIRKYQENCKCVICGYNCFGPLFFTFELNTRYLHVQCAMLPRKVKHMRHLHDLTLCRPLDEKGKYFEFFCDACEQERDPDDHVYYCDPSCEYVAHIGCGVSGRERPIQDILGTCHVYELSKGVKQEEKFSELVEQEEEEEEDYDYDDNNEEEEEEEDVLHFGHNHVFVLFNYKRPIDIKCRGCFASVFGKTYSCKSCFLYLHKWCAQLPKEIQHWLHPQHGSLKITSPSPDKPLKNAVRHRSTWFYDCRICPKNRDTLNDGVEDYNLFHKVDEKDKEDDEEGDKEDDEEGDEEDNLVDYIMDKFPQVPLITGCPVCYEDCYSPKHSLLSKLYGFFYKCEKCRFKIHGLCAMLPENLNHQSHKHPLRIYKHEKGDGSSKKPLCQACKFPCDEVVSLNCERCNFYLHIQCFLLPYTGKHITHLHNLILTYSYKEDPRALEYFCDTCEKPRVPNRWVYCCPDPKCYIVSHMDCVVPNPFIVSEIKSENNTLC